MHEKYSMNDIPNLKYEDWYQIIMLDFQIIICFTFILKVMMKSNILSILCISFCGISLIVTLLDFVYNFYKFTKNKNLFSLLINIWFFVKHSLFPVILGVVCLMK